MSRSCKLIFIFFGVLPLCVSDAAWNGEACPRPGSGSQVESPAEVRASNGRLQIAFSFRSEVDDYGLTRYCYVYANAVEAPTLRVSPGDDVSLDLKNELSPSPAGSMPEHRHMQNPCSSGPMTAVSTNLHFHGLEIPPVCHQDDVIHTLVQPSEDAFQYHFRIPASQPPGLYWYHPHPHGLSESQVLGGASGALIVEGIARVKPEVANLPERILVLRDQPASVGRQRNGRLSDQADDQAEVGGKDISLNFVPVIYPLYLPAVIRVTPDRREFWRVLNASADTYFTLQVVSVESGQRVAQNLELIAMDGAPVSREVTAARRASVLISPGGRAEFVVTTPKAGAISRLISRGYDTGPDGARNPDRIIANIVAAGRQPEVAPAPVGSPAHGAAWRFTGLAGLRPVRVRKLYFSEDLGGPGAPAKYFITVEGKTPAVFDMNFRKPDISVRQGTVEDWIVENRTRESHVFHIHQIHFQLIGRDGLDVNEPDVNESMLRDTIDLAYWDGKSTHYPNVRLRMDFRAPQIVGTFLFHCHILEHEDGGMMGSVEVIKAR